jgi:hypothetical protein
MLKYKAQKEDGTLCIGLGFSEENIKRLQEGQPIAFDLKELGLPPLEFFVFVGKDEATMHKELMEKAEFAKNGQKKTK